jgi:hypothetical protein
MPYMFRWHRQCNSSQLNNDVPMHSGQHQTSNLLVNLVDTCKEKNKEKIHTKKHKNHIQERK